MYVTAVESFQACIGELLPHLTNHWKELGMYQDRMPLAPQYIAYVQKERTGELLFVTIRKDRELVGYYICFISACLHYQTTIKGTMDICRIVPEHRKTNAAVQLFLAVNEELIKRGVNIWYTASKIPGGSHEAMTKLVTKFGFEPVDMYFCKWLQG